MKSLLISQKSIVALLAIITLIFTVHNISEAQTTNYTHIYVDAVNGTNGPNRGTEGKPYKSITFALLISERTNLPDPWHVHILPGTYDGDPEKPASEREVFPLKLRSKMIFEGTTTAAECIIDAQHLGATQFEILRGIDVEGVVIRNLTIQNMNRIHNYRTYVTDNAGGIVLWDSTGTRETPNSIETCVIHNNHPAGISTNVPLLLTLNTISNNRPVGVWTSVSISASYNTFTANVGGLRVEGESSGDLTENTIQGHSSWGVFVMGTLKGNVTHNTFTNNVNGFSGGTAFFVTDTFVGDLTHNTFDKNSTSNVPYRIGGGACYIASFTGDIAHNTFTQNAMQGGDGGGGGAFHIKNFKGDITDNTFTQNSVSTINRYGGGAFHITTFTGDITNNTFTQNSVVVDGNAGGGAFRIENFTGDVSHNTFTANQLKLYHTGRNRYLHGAGFYVERLTGNVIYNIFTKNSTPVGSDRGSGGGFWITALAGNITHNIFDGNSGSSGGAFYLQTSSNTVEASNNIFFNNTSTRTGDSIVTRHATRILNNLFMISDELSGGISEGATVWVNSAETRFHNNIFSGLKTAIFTEGTLDLPITHNLFHNIEKSFVNQGGNDLGNELLFWELLAENAMDNLEGSPLLVDPVGDRNFHLRATSPAIDAGTNAFAPADDYDGNARPVGETVDIGPYEYNGDTADVSTPVFLDWDVNEDGHVNILDIVVVSQNLGESEPDNPRADVNGDGAVNILDIVLISQHLGESSGAPAAHTSVSVYQNVDSATIRTWINLAQVADDGSAVYREGIANLKRLLTANVPQKTALLANYPNPFNPETWMPYQLAKPAEVSVSIYAADGKLIRTLALGHQAAGVYHNRSRAAYWDGKNAIGESVASGVFFYTLKAGDFTASRKMLILK